MRKLARPFADRFWEKVDRSGGPFACWLWLGRLQGGYGTFWFAGRYIRAHRFAYIAFVGPIPEGMDLDHVRARGCTHKNCVNPAHLEAVSARVNTLRGDAPAAKQARQTHCKRGHPLTPDNLMVNWLDRYGRRSCLACYRARHPGTHEPSLADVEVSDACRIPKPPGRYRSLRG